MKYIYFDMDGTIADLYNCKNWLDNILAGKGDFFADLEPMYKADEMKKAIITAKAKGYGIGIISYTAIKGINNKEYIKIVRKAKTEWLAKYFPYADKIHLVKEIKNKATYAEQGDILIDDNEPNRKRWNKGKAINPNGNIIRAIYRAIGE